MVPHAEFLIFSEFLQLEPSAWFMCIGVLVTHSHMYYSALCPCFQGMGHPRLCTRQDYAGQVLWVSTLQYDVPARFLPTRDTITPFFAAFEGADKKGWKANQGP